MYHYIMQETVDCVIVKGRVSITSKGVLFHESLDSCPV
jgi:hypothetical protein